MISIRSTSIFNSSQIDESVLKNGDELAVGLQTFLVQIYEEAKRNISLPEGRDLATARTANGRCGFRVKQETLPHLLIMARKAQASIGQSVVVHQRRPFRYSLNELASRFDQEAIELLDASLMQSSLI